LEDSLSSHFFTKLRVRLDLIFHNDKCIQSYVLFAKASHHVNAVIAVSYLGSDDFGEKSLLNINLNPFQVLDVSSKYSQTNLGNGHLLKVI
jgi:hypothetical protein